MGRSTLLPVKLDASEPPFGFGDVQAADLSSWDGDYHHPQWGRFANAVLAKTRPVDGESAPPPQASPQPEAPPAPAAPQAPLQHQPQPGGWQTPPPNPQTGAAWTGAAAGAAENLTPIEYIQKCLRLFVDGKGRARRAEYGWFVVFCFVIGLIAAFIDLTLSGGDPYATPVVALIAGSVT